jgi:hypothetical protein
MSKFISFILTNGSAALTFLGGGPLTWFLGALDTVWSSTIGRLIIVGFGAFLVGWVWCWTGEHSKIHEAVAAATHARDAEWQGKIAAANAANEKRVREALDEARKVKPVPAAAADLIRLCKSDASFRGALGKR